MAAVTEKDRNALHFAAFNGNIDIVKLLIGHRNKDMIINSQDIEGSTPLYAAAVIPKEPPGVNFDIVELLVRNGADLDINIESGKTVIHKIVETGDVRKIAVFQKLIEFGADLNDQDDDGNTPTHLAVISFRGKHFLEILAPKANLEVKNNKGDTPLVLAGRIAGVEKIKVLIQNGAEADALNDDGITALHFALTRQKWKMAEYLIANGANIDVKTKEGTPMVVSLVFSNNEEALK